jgi:CDP-glycerol glycerophosphotransferase (TagB/SpsB family)
LDPLIATGWRIIVRPHPQSKKSEKDLLSRLEKRYTGTSIIFDYTDENLFSLSRADIMISDFSSIIFDFVFLFQKPVLYANAYFELELYDASDLSHLPWKLQIVGELGKELTENQLPNIKEIISDVVKNPETKVKCNEVKNIAWQYIGESGKRTADYLISKQKELAKA